MEQAIPYWQQAGHRAAQRSANVEAVSSPPQGLDLLETLPETPERTQHELAVQSDPGRVVDRDPGLGGPGSRRSLHPGRGTVPAGGGDAAALSRAVWGCGRFSQCGRSSRPRGSWGNNSCTSRKGHTILPSWWRRILRWETLFCMGEFEAARRHWSRAWPL